MPVTPQAIKDQEFQPKFRGYDTVEVKAYLELLAEEFFELIEGSRKTSEENDILEQEKEGLIDLNEKYVGEIEQLKADCQRLEKEVENKNEQFRELLLEMDELQTSAADHDQEKRELSEEISECEAKIQDAEERILKERQEKEKWISKVKVLEEQNKELRREELEFRSTLGAAQKFSQEVREKSEKEAHRIMERARKDVIKFREASSKELSRIPREIEELRIKRDQVRDELKALLNTYMEAVDAFAEDEDDARVKDVDDSYQKILAGENEEAVEPIEIIEKVENEGSGIDDLDKVSMDLDLPLSLLDDDA